MKKLLTCLSTSLFLAVGVNYANHQNYINTIYKVHTVDINMLNHLLPTKLSQALIHQYRQEIQNTVNSNYGLFGIVVTDCNQAEQICKNENIIAISQPQRAGWSEKVVAQQLSKFQYDLLKDPPPRTAERHFVDSRATEQNSTGKVNPGQIIGRVYYIRKEPVLFDRSQVEWLSKLPKAATTLVTTGRTDLASKQFYEFFYNGVNIYYVLTNIGFLSIGLLIWQVWERSSEKRIRLARENEKIKSRNSELNLTINSLRTNISTNEKEKKVSETKVEQLTNDLKSLCETTEPLKKNIIKLQSKIAAKELEIDGLRQESSQAQRELESRLQASETRYQQERTDLQSQLDRQRHLLSTQYQTQISETQRELESRLQASETRYQQKRRDLQLQLDRQRQLLSTQYQIQIARTQQELESRLQESENTYQQERIDLRSELDRQRVESLNREKQLRVNLETLQQSFNFTRNELLRNRNNLDDTQSKLDTTIDELSRSEIKIKNLEKEKEIYEQILEDSDDELSQLRKQLYEHNNEYINAFDSENKDLRNENYVLVEQVKELYAELEKKFQLIDSKSFLPDLSRYKIAIVSGHCSTRRKVREYLCQYKLKEKNFIEIPPSKEERISEKIIRDRISNCDIVIVVTSYTGHNSTEIVKQLRSKDALSDKLLEIYSNSALLKG